MLILFIYINILKYQYTCSQPGGFVETIFCSTFRVSDSVGLQWGPRICLSNKWPDVAGLGTTLRELQSLYLGVYLSCGSPELAQSIILLLMRQMIVTLSSLSSRSNKHLPDVCGKVAADPLPPCIKHPYAWTTRVWKVLQDHLVKYKCFIIKNAEVICLSSALSFSIYILISTVNLLIPAKFSFFSSKTQRRHNKFWTFPIGICGMG